MGFRILTSPKTSLKHKFKGKMSYMKLERSKLCETYCIRRILYHSIFGINFRIIPRKSHTFNSIQVHSLERDKTTSFGKVKYNLPRFIFLWFIMMHP